MLKLLINSGAGDVDYTKYVIPSSISIDDSVNTPTLFSFTLSNVNGAFVPPRRSSYVRLVSTLGNGIPETQSKSFQQPGFQQPGFQLFSSITVIASGYITNSPEFKFLGLSQSAGQMFPQYALTKTRFQQYEVDIKVTSDEYLLNEKSVPFIAAYINQTMGQILRNIAETLAPGFFDTTGIKDGDLIPFFAYDPTRKWVDVAKEFSDTAQYRYSVLDKKISFAPYGDKPLGVTYNETTQRQSQFVPGALHTGVLAVPLVNDAIVFGDVEPQQMHDDNFCGDGFTGNFPLKYKMFRGATNLLLQEDWTGQTFNTSLWNVQDLEGQFILAGALNAISFSGGTGNLGEEYILAQSGVELGGHVVLQHGEFQFNDACVGIVGGLYNTEASLVANTCIAGFDLRTAPATTVVVTASGANGIQICPIVSGALVGTPVVSRQNHHYILQTSISVRMPVRYNQLYRTLAGTPFGDDELPAQSEVTFTITDIDLAQAYNVATLNDPFVPAYIPVVTKYTSVGQPLPAFAAYVILNSINLNLTVNTTEIFSPPQGTLQVASLTGAQTTNVLALTGGQMPPFDVTDPLALQIGTPLGPVIHYPLGFGFQDATATVAALGDADTLEFYSPDSIPGVGSRIRLQAWQAGVSVSRIQDPVSIADEAAVVGDDGLRTAVVNDLKPKPRTSYDCDLAGQAYVEDREQTQYDGSYTVESLFWDNTQDYPRSGKFLNVTSPQRNMSGAQLLVRGVRTSVLDMRSEILLFNISFGQDLYLEKMLRRFVAQPTGTAGVLQPQDTAVAPNPQNLPPAGTQFTTYLDNLVDARIFQITGTRVLFDMGTIPATGVEIRRSDTGWTSNKQNLYGKFHTQQFFLPRVNYDQTWYLRLVNGSRTSRFTRVFRVNYPMVPLPPSNVVVTPGTSANGTVQKPVIQVCLPTVFDRNIYGVQIDKGHKDLNPCQAVTLVSTDPSDIRFMDVVGTDGEGNDQIETVELNGTTPVSTIHEFCTISKVILNPRTVVQVNDPNGITWLVYVDDEGQLQATSLQQSRNPPLIYLKDHDTGTTSWIMGMTTDGDITTTTSPAVVDQTGFQLTSSGELTFTVVVHNNGELFTI